MNSQSQKALTLKQEKIFVIAVCICVFFIGFQRSGSQLIASDVAILFGLGESGVGTLSFIRHIPPFFLPLVAGIIADNTGKKNIVVAFTFVFGIGCAICGFSKALPSLVIGILVFSSGSCVSEMVATAALADIGTEKCFHYINISQLFFSIGAFLGPLVFSYFQSQGKADWKFPFAVGFLSFTVCGIAYMLVKFPDNPKPAKTSCDNSSKIGHQSLAEMFSFLSPIIFVLFIMMTIYIGMESGYGGFVSSVMESKQASSSVVAYVLSAFWGGTAISRLFFGFVTCQKKKLIRLCFTFSAILLLMISLIPAGIISIIISGLIGFTYGPIWGGLETIVASCAEGKSASAIGFLSVACGLGGLIFPELMGLFANYVSMEYALIVLAIASAFAALLWYTTKQK